MPEEINRIVTDHISTLFFIPSPEAKKHLNKEGITKSIYQVGDVMRDMINLSIHQNLIQKPTFSNYYYCTLHRPYNVDEKSRLSDLLDQLERMNKPIVFSRHPRTKNKMSQFNMKDIDYKNIQFIDPVSYFINLGFIQNCAGLITDSGGMQKEAYWLKKRCATIRTETEWVETLENGWNTLLFDHLNDLNTVFETSPGLYNESLYGDGKASEKIRTHLLNFFKTYSG